MHVLPETNEDYDWPTESASPALNVKRQRELFEQPIELSSQQAQREFLQAQNVDDPQMALAVERLWQPYSDDSSHWLNNDLLKRRFMLLKQSLKLAPNLMDMNLSSYWVLEGWGRLVGSPIRAGRSAVFNSDGISQENKGF